jgi:hypothetical protein
MCHHKAGRKHPHQLRKHSGQEERLIIIDTTYTKKLSLPEPREGPARIVICAGYYLHKKPFSMERERMNHKCSPHSVFTVCAHRPLRFLPFRVQ